MISATRDYYEIHPNKNSLKPNETNMKPPLGFTYRMTTYGGGEFVYPPAVES